MTLLTSKSSNLLRRFKVNPPSLHCLCFLIAEKKTFCDAESSKHTTHAKSNYLLIVLGFLSSFLFHLLKKLNIDYFHSETFKAKQTIDTTAK